MTYFSQHDSLKFFFKRNKTKKFGHHSLMQLHNERGYLKKYIPDFCVYYKQFKINFNILYLLLLR